MSTAAGILSWYTPHAGNQRMAELSLSLSRSTIQVMSLAGSVLNGPTHDRQEVQINLMALNLDMSGSSM